MKRVWTAFMAVLMVAVLTAGCTRRAGESPAPAPKPQEPLPAQATVLAPLFFSDRQAQHVIPEPRLVRAEQDLSNQAYFLVKELLKGPTDPFLGRSIPANVQMRDVVVHNGLATVDFSKEFSAIQSTTDVTVALTSLRLTLTELPGIQKVEVTVEGKRGVVLSHGLQLGPMDRGFYGDFRFFFDAERAANLQQRVNQGQDAWRLDPARVLQWEGRAFGFTEAELKQAELKPSGTRVNATLTGRDKVYIVELQQGASGAGGGIWSVVAIRTAVNGPDTAGATSPVYFADWQAHHVTPEPRQVSRATAAETATALVKEIIAGPKDPHLFRSIPAEVRLLEPVKVVGGLATVNLSEEIKRVHGAAGEAMALGSLVQTLTELPGISRVEVLVGGQRGAVLEHVVLDKPLARSLHTYPPLRNPDREKYLQQQAEKGIETWRLDATATLRWEGRMFGFTQAELQAATVTGDASTAKAVVSARGRKWQVELTRYKRGGVWVVTNITDTK